jgi:hypothetical protein
MNAGVISINTTAEHIDGVSNVATATGNIISVVVAVDVLLMCCVHLYVLRCYSVRWHRQRKTLIFRRYHKIPVVGLRILQEGYCCCH